MRDPIQPLVRKRLSLTQRMYLWRTMPRYYSKIEMVRELNRRLAQLSVQYEVNLRSMWDGNRLAVFRVWGNNRLRRFLTSIKVTIQGQTARLKREFDHSKVIHLN